KEFFVNEAHARADMLLHAAVLGEANLPPAGAAEGDCWLFAGPRNGMTIYDEAAGQNRRFVDGWQAAAPVAEPSGGLIVDSQARSAVAGLVAALVAGGILPAA